MGAEVSPTALTADMSVQQLLCWLALPTACLPHLWIRSGNSVTRPCEHRRCVAACGPLQSIATPTAVDRKEVWTRMPSVELSHCELCLDCRAGIPQKWNRSQHSERVGRGVTGTHWVVVAAAAVVRLVAVVVVGSFRQSYS